MCAVPTLVTTPQSGPAMRARAAISLGLESQQLQGQAETVVQVAARLEYIELRAECGGHGFLGCGFACGAGNGDNAFTPAAADMCRKGLQGGKWIFCDEQWQGQHCIGKCGHTGTRDDSGHSAAR